MTMHSASSCLGGATGSTVFENVLPNVRANRHFAAGRVWARLLESKPGPPQSVRLSDQLGHSEQKHKWNWLHQREEFEHAKVRILHNFYLNT